MKVLITVDTEIWPRIKHWPYGRQASPRELRDAFEVWVLGRTAAGDFGLPLLLEDLRRHDLKAVFFVEALAAAAGAADLVRETVDMIQAAGQDVQLHAHTEWLSPERPPGLTTRQFLTDYDLDEQRTIIGHARDLLCDAGARGISAFRAGNLRANEATIEAAADNGITFEMSFLGGATPRNGQQRSRSSPACTVLPVTCLSYLLTWRPRPAQLGSISARELQTALHDHAAAGNHYFCVLLHSFELVTRAAEGPPRPNPVNLARWKTLCEMLASHRDLMPTIHTEEIVHSEPVEPAVVPGMHRHLPERWAEQVWSRLT